MGKHTTQRYGNWWQGPSQLQPAPDRDLRADVAIVGGGFTGLYTALNLRRAGVDVVVLEREFAGAGASGRNSGFVDGLIGKDFPSLLRLYKEDRARELCHFGREAVLKLEDFIRNHAIDCEYVGNGNINAAVHPRQIRRLKQLEAAAAGLDMHFTYLGREAMRERGLPEAFVAGVHDPVGGVLNPGALVKAVRALAIAEGVRLYEQTPVLRVRDAAPVRIETPKATVTADRAVLATNAYTAQLGWKKRFLSPIWAGMFESAPLSEEQRAALRWTGGEGVYTAHEKLESYRLTERNTLIAGGKFVKVPFGFRLRDISQPKMAAAFEAVFRQRFPELQDLELEKFWGGWIGIPLDFMPGAGVTGKHRNIHYGIGYAGHGVPQTLLLGEIIAARILGRTHPLANVLRRKTFPIPPEPFKWLVSQAVDKALGMMDRKTDRLVRKKR